VTRCAGRVVQRQPSPRGVAGDGSVQKHSNRMA
jgi:hypothetical protein